MCMFEVAIGCLQEVTRCVTIRKVETSINFLEISFSVYLSPQSKRMKLDHLCHSMADIGRRATKKSTLVDRQSMPDAQSSEIAEVVRTIQHTEQGQQQLQEIFSEADQSGEGHGELLKEIWDRDVTDMERFFKDQKSNGELSSSISVKYCKNIAAITILPFCFYSYSYWTDIQQVVSGHHQ